MKQLLFVLVFVHFIILIWGCSNNLTSQAQKEYDKKNYSKVIQLLSSQNSIESKILKSNAYLTLGDYDHAYALFDTNDYQLDTVKFLMVEILYKQNKYNDGIKLLKELLSKYPQKYIYLEKIVKAYNNNEDFKSLLLASNTGLNYYPDSMIFHLGKGRALSEFHDLKGADSIYRSIINFSKNNKYKSDAYRFLAGNTDDIKKKLEYLKQSYNLDSTSSYINFELGEIYLQNHSVELGCKLLRRAVSDKEMDNHLDLDYIFDLIKDNCN